MNPKIFFGLIFGIPTVLLVYIYYDLGINNLWQLFLFIWAIIFGYMPGIITMHTFYVIKRNSRRNKRNNIQKTLVDM